MKQALDFSPLRFWKRLSASTCPLLFLVLIVGAASGQSTEQELPTPIRASDINATIAVRDLGDPRLTRHFYVFTGVPGDLIISVESKNLDGDVDVFTASGLRPLVKISLYASEMAAKTTKSIYLRARQDLVLRVEARSPNEEPGSYRLQFGGSFEPFAGEIAAGDNPATDEEPPTLSSTKKGRRVSAVGARIEEPPAPVEEKAAADQPVTEKIGEPEKTEPVVANAEPPRTNRRRPPARVRPSRPATRKPPATARVEPATPDDPETTPAGATPAETPTLAPTQSETGPRLLIETVDGEKIERSMNTVRRVVVDNGQIIVILKTGRIERLPLSSVTRMSIEP